MARQSPACKTLLSIPGVGLITATALVAATAGDVTHFSSARHFGSWIALTPREHSSANTRHLHGISKRGDNQLRVLLTHGAGACACLPSPRPPGDRWTACAPGR
jgi:transposase